MFEIEEKVWGTATRLHIDDLSTTDLLTIVRGGSCSWHYHEHKFNMLYVLSGSLRVTYQIPNDQHVHVTNLGVGEVFIIQPMTLHRFLAMENTTAIEISYVENRPNDITRMDKGFVNDRV